MWKLQGGSYIPGFSRQAYGAGLQRDVIKTRKDQAKKAAALQKYMSKRGSLGKWAGNIVGAGVGVGLGAMGMGPLGLTIGKTLGAGLGSALGSSKMISGEGPSMAPGAGTGLLGSTYEQLGEAKGGIDESMRGQAYGAGAAQLASGLTGMAGEKLGGQLGDMFGKWKAGRTGLSGYEGTGMANAFGLGGDRTPSLPGFEGYSGFGMNPQGFQSGGALGKAFGLNRPSFNTGSRVSDDEGWISEYKPGQTKGWMSTVDELASDTDARRKDLDELGGMGAPEESMLERIKGAAGSMFNPFHGVEKEAPMQQYAQQLSPEIMSLLEEYGGKDEPEREPFDLLGKIGGLGRGAGNVLSSVINPFHGMEREAPRSSWTGQPMQMGGMMPGGVSNALPYQEGGEAPNNGILSKLNQLSDMQKFYEGEGPRTESGDLKFGPKGMITREGLAEQYNFPLEEAVFDTSYGEPGSGNMAIDINIPSDDRLMKYQRSGNMPEKKAEFMHKSRPIEDDMRKSFPDEYQSLATDIGFGDYSGAAEKVGSGWLDMSPLERMRSNISSLDSKKNIPSESNVEKQMMMKALGIEDEAEYDSFMKWKKSQGMQMGGSISPYNLGGSVTQQPMAYQLGGLLKYKRSPMMG
jgi:hypothetical protein